MRKISLVAATGFGAALIAAPAFARSMASTPVFSHIPPSDRLSLVGVFSGAMPTMQLVYSALMLAVVAALAVWLVQIVRLQQRRTKGVARAIAYLSGQAAAAPLFGLCGMTYGLLTICIGITNKRPGPTLIALGPGFAEVLLALGLGLFAAAIATVAHRHLSARLQTVAAI